MIPSKTISTYTQDGTTHPIYCTGFITTTIRAIRTKNIDLALRKHCYYKVLAINYILTLYN